MSFWDDIRSKWFLRWYRRAVLFGYLESIYPASANVITLIVETNLPSPQIYADVDEMTEDGLLELIDRVPEYKYRLSAEAARKVNK